MVLLANWNMEVLQMNAMKEQMEYPNRHLVALMEERKAVYLGDMCPVPSRNNFSQESSDRLGMV